MKMRSPRTVPLSKQAVDALRCLNELRNLSPYVSPGERDHERPMSNNTILKALERLGYKHRMTGHGFRGVATIATISGPNGCIRKSPTGTDDGGFNRSTQRIG
jgi:integrase